STASTVSIRTSNFDIFLHTHNLFFIFYLLLLVHASGRVLKYQTNVEDHPPGCLRLNVSTVEDYGSVTEVNGGVPLNIVSEITTGLFHTHGELLINNTMKICTKDPTFHPHFPE
ncbi:unnamed protein product, partial [Staurois parvus]